MYSVRRNAEIEDECRVGIHIICVICVQCTLTGMTNSWQGKLRCTPKHFFEKISSILTFVISQNP